MSEYRQGKSRTMTAGEEREFRQKVNALCDAERNYKGKRFGEGLEILEVYDAPIYQASLKSQHDRRTLHFTRPTPTSTRYTARVTDPRQVDVAQVAPYPTQYTNRQEDIEIEGSRESRTCGNCGGNGTERCGRCGGTGEVTAEENCPACHGKGYITGTRNETYWVNESGYGNYTSGGKGRQMRVRTVEVHTKCTRCGGKGKLHHQETCPRCHGSGRVTCHTCQGTGMLMQCIEMRHEQYVEVRNRYVTPGILSGNDASELCKALDKATPGWRTHDRYEIQGTDYARCDGNNLPVVGHIVREVTSEVKSTADDRVCFNTLSVSECGATAIMYRFGGKDYAAVMYGSDNTLFMATSPISDYFNGLRDSIEESAARTDYGNSWKHLRRLVESSQGTDRDRETLRRLEERLAKTSMVGYLAGLAVAAILIFPPLVYYLACFNIVAPWTDLIYRLMYSPVVDSAPRALLGLGIAFWIARDGIFLSKYTWRHQSGTLRFALGLLNGVLAMTLCALAICVANYLGLIHLAMLVILAILALISTAISLILAVVMLVAPLLG